MMKAKIDITPAKGSLNGLWASGRDFLKAIRAIGPLMYVITSATDNIAANFATL